MTFSSLNGSMLHMALVGSLGLSFSACAQKGADTAATVIPTDSQVQPLPPEPSPVLDLPSDLTVAELYRLTETPGVQNVMVLFHASWCEPCKIMETPEYQAAIRDFNDSQGKTRVVTLRVDNESDLLMDSFWTYVGPVAIQLDNIKTGESKIVEDSIIPSALLVHVPNGTYARSMKVPPSAADVAPWADKGFRYPERFEKTLPPKESLTISQ